jgi:hypothetical protein
MEHREPVLSGLADVPMLGDPSRGEDLARKAGRTSARTPAHRAFVSPLSGGTPREGRGSTQGHPHPCGWSEILDNDAPQPFRWLGAMKNAGKGVKKATTGRAHPRRSRRRRSLRTTRRGVASVVAVTLVLLLAVASLANYLVNVLPAQQQASEFSHVLQVEDQLEQLQADILAEAAQPDRAITLAAPLTLGSASIPPFGSPSPGTLGLVANGSMASTFGFSIAELHKPAINWNPLGCLGSTSGHCSGNGQTNYYNWTHNDTTLTATITGGNDNVILNITGNQDVISLSYNGKNNGYILIAIRGDNNTISFSAGGGSSPNPIQIVISGTGDTYSASFGGASGGIGFNVVTQFIGTEQGTCPASNAAATNQVGVITTGGSNGRNINQTLVFWNNVGYFSGPTVVPMPINGAANDNNIIWENTSGFVPCAFTQARASNFNQSAVGGLFVQLADRYYPAVRFDFEQGALILAEEGANATLVGPPPFTPQLTPAGWTLSITLTQFVVQNFTALNGYGTVAIATRLLHESTFHLLDGVQGNEAILTPEYLNITTPFPDAWAGFLGQYPHLVPSVHVYPCTVPANSQICGPRAGEPTSVVVAPLYVVGITLRIVTVALTLE